MPIVQQGSVNTTALTNPGIYVQIVQPALAVAGVPTNVLGIVGTATWGPVNQATIVGPPADYQRKFGAIQSRKYDMGTAQYIAAQQGAAQFRCVRVTDNTDVAATITVLTNCLTVTGVYTGSLGNSIKVTAIKGSAANTTAVTVAVPGYPSEKFDNIAGTGNALWVAIAAALNTGVGSTAAGPSAWVRATAGVGTTAPSLGTAYTLAGGTDGVSSITSTTLVGSDAAPRKGMYCLRSQGCAIGLLADADDSTQWTIQGAFGLAEGIYMVLTAAAGLAISNGSTGDVDIKATAGLDTYAAKLMAGDWIWWNDQVTGVTRQVSEAPFVAGLLANLSPEQSSLNKPLAGVVGSQTSGTPGSGQFGVYAAADLAVLFQAGIDVIANPAPAGSIWAVARGCNSSSNPAVNGDNYTTLTNYIAKSMARAFGLAIGQVITAKLMHQIRAAQLDFLASMTGQGQLSSPDGSIPYSVVLDASNNPNARTSLGYLQSDVSAKYGPILLFLLINLDGGQTVVITPQTPPGT